MKICPLSWKYADFEEKVGDLEDAVETGDGGLFCFLGIDVAG